jgi:hypothetical protein
MDIAEGDIIEIGTGASARRWRITGLDKDRSDAIALIAEVRRVAGQPQKRFT